VTRDGTRLDRLGDRGQLLLVGAVAIAVIILGLVVVYNTILFTETRAPTQSLDDTSDADTLRVQTTNTTRKLVQFTAADRDLNCSDSANFTDAITESLTNATGGGNKSLRKGLTQIKAKGGVRYVTITSADATCQGTTASADVSVELSLVVRTPEIDYNTTTNRTYEPEP